MRRFGVILAGAAGLVASLMSGQAYAVTCTGTPLNNPASVPFATLAVAGTCVQFDDKLFGNFAFGNLPTGIASNVVFSVNGNAHNVGFNANYVSGIAYAGLAYQVAITIGPNFITSLSGDFTESFGNLSTLVKNSLAPNAGTLSCDRGTGVTPANLCPHSIIYGAGVTGLSITESLTVGSTAQISAILDTIFQTPQTTTTPEPASLALLGSALLGFGLLRRRRKAA